MADLAEEAIELYRAALEKNKGNVARMAPERNEKRASTIHQEEQMKAWRYRRHWLATGHCLGGSFAKLAFLDGVTRASIVQAVDKLLPVEIRANARVRTEILMTELVYYQDVYTQHREGLSKLTPTAAANWLLENEPFSGEGG